MATARAGASGPSAIRSDSVVALHQTHVDVEAAVDLAPVVDGDDMGFLQDRGGVGFALESGPKRGVV